MPESVCIDTTKHTNISGAMHATPQQRIEAAREAQRNEEQELMALAAASAEVADASEHQTAILLGLLVKGRHSTSLLSDATVQQVFMQLAQMLHGATQGTCSGTQLAFCHCLSWPRQCTACSETYLPVETLCSWVIAMLFALQGFAQGAVSPSQA